MATLAAGLEAFKTIYDNAISDDSKRDIESIDQDWQTINNEMTCYYNNTATGDSSSAQTNLDNIVAILEGEPYNMTIDTPIPLPLSLSLSASPSTILIPSDADGTNPVYTDAISTITVTIGTDDDTSNWTFAVQSVTGVTAAIQNDNEVKINSIAADSGSVTVRATQTSYATLDIIIPAQKQKQGETGLGWTGGSYAAGTGIVTFTSDDGLGFATGDLRGADGTNGTDGVGALAQQVNDSMQRIDEGSPAGNARGTEAVDLQYGRNFATQVASGAYSVVGGGDQNTGSATWSFVGGGVGNNASGLGFFIGGGNGNAGSGQYGAIPGGVNSNVSGDYSQVLGSEDTVADDAVTVVGVGGTSTTNGEIIQSSSDSPNQISTFILERVTSSTDQVALQSVGRNTLSITPQSIQIADDTAFSGTLDLTAYQADGSLYREKVYINFWCSGASVVSAPVTSAEYLYNSGGFTGTIAYGVGTANQLDVNVTPSGATSTKWVCKVEGIIMDI